MSASRVQHQHHQQRNLSDQQNPQVHGNPEKANGGHHKTSTEIWNSSNNPTRNPSDTSDREQPKENALVQYQHSSACNSFASAPSATPTSRPSSSAFGTPSCQYDGSEAPNTNQQLGQCRICRKSISGAEPVHLCSNCNHSICDDCASYSAAEMHWMCSSCRRRAMNPAISADALKELGLNHNSSPVRRMATHLHTKTLRLNQNELKAALNKSSSESAGSSNSSSSMSTSVSQRHNSSNPQTQPQKVRQVRGSIQVKEFPKTMLRDQQQLNLERNSHNQTSDWRRKSCASVSPLDSTQATPKAHLATKQNQELQCDTKEGILFGAEQINSPSSESKFRRPSAQVDNLLRDNTNQQLNIRSHQLIGQQKTMSQPLSANRQAIQRPSQSQVERRTSCSINNSPISGAIDQVAIRTHKDWSDHIDGIQGQATQLAQSKRRASMATSKIEKQPRQVQNWRKQSIAFVQQNSFAHHRSVDPRTALAQHLQKFVQPQTIVTASSENPIDPIGSQGDISSRRSSHRDSFLLSQQQHPNMTLIPVPPDQIHLRRLSDQSNLVRRSSIIADTFDGISMSRNRSHSDIDAVNYLSFFSSQQQLEQLHQDPNQSYTNQRQLGYSLNDNQQRRSSDQWELHRQQQQQQQQYLIHNSQQAQNPQISSIITSYSQKHRDSTEDLNSDSSSDIDEATQDLTLNQNTLDYEDQPNGYFGQPQLAYMQPMQPVDRMQMSIPSVSVSEFSNNQQRMHQPQKNQFAYDPITTTPTQINVAIEHAILEQQRRQSVHETLMPSHLSMRRGSNNRILPKIPNEQSRSLLDLQHQRLNQNSSLMDGNSRLDLPSISSTIRRASAPEGQNIKIVVDDMDGSVRVNGTAKGSTRSMNSKPGNLLERIVLYRDDSIDPNTNTCRGFGLSVTGGKIDVDGQLLAYVTWVLVGGPADKVGLEPGDTIIEWDGKCLIDLTYEQVAEIIEDSANIAELLVKPVRKLSPQFGSNLVRSQRRLSQQTELDMRKLQQQVANNQYQEAFKMNLDWRNDDAEHHRHSTSYQSNGNQMKMMDSSGQYQMNGRSGTGRRLPQIPTNDPSFSGGLMAAPMTNRMVSTSTGQLEDSSRYTDLRGMPSMLSASHEQNQSRSATELTTSHVGLNAYPLSIMSNCEQQAAHSIGFQNQQYHMGTLSIPPVRDEIHGLIGLQVNVDEKASQLEISILSAINIIRDPTLEYYVKVKILPDSNRFKPCTTQPSSDLNWKETFLIQNFPIQQIHRMALEIGIWAYEECPRLTTQIAQPICETMIPIQSARDRNTDFWPLRAPPSSPQARRKSLNDLIESHSSRRRDSAMTTAVSQNPNGELRQVATETSPAHYYNAICPDQPIGLSRERSASNRNLPDFSRLQAQARRASDEVATASSHRLLNKLSPTPSRRSISVMSVIASDNHTSLFQQKSSPRLASQANIAKPQPTNELTQRARNAAKQHSSPTSRCSSESKAPPTPVVGVTSSGRRSSLAGINSMAGYRSQKNSQSDATDQDTSMASAGRPSHSSTPKKRTSDSSRRPKQQVNNSVTASPTQSGHCSSGAGSRRNSGEKGAHLQRRSSFAILRKLKRTMSLTKNSDGELNRSGHNSRHSSCSSSESEREAQVEQDLGATRNVNPKKVVGRVKLSFLMTKGQFELEIICAHVQDYDTDSSAGVYVKVYLKGKGKSNKRKTKIIQVSGSVVVFMQKVKYDASLMDNKTLEVSLWVKKGGRRGKIAIGYTEIRPSELDLAQVQTSWYNLRSMESQTSSSIDDWNESLK